MTTTNFRELRAEFMVEPERARLVTEAKERVAAERAAYEQSLAEIRRARALTQAQLAKLLDVSQAQVSRIEHQADLYLSTLVSYLEAMGGRLELTAVFQGTRVPIAIGALTEPSEEAATEERVPAQVGS